MCMYNCKHVNDVSMYARVSVCMCKYIPVYQIVFIDVFYPLSVNTSNELVCNFIAFNNNKAYCTVLCCEQ